MTQGERVKEVRKTLNLTLEKFGEKLGVGKTAISKIEKSERSLTEQMAKAISREFRVNYFWLTEGNGDMFTSTPQSTVDEIAEDYNLDADDKRLIEKYLELPEEHRKILKDYLRSVFN